MESLLVRHQAFPNKGLQDGGIGSIPVVILVGGNYL
jgi:hypothetical protein